MIQFYAQYSTVIDFFLISVGFAYSQQIVLRAGVFSIATGGFAGLGAYAVALMATKTGVPIPLAIFLGAALGALTGYLLSVPLAQLRGAFQAIATLAFIKVMIALLLYFEAFTGGALGVKNIPRVTNTWILIACVAAVMYVSWSVGRSGVGRVFDALRQDEQVAASLGASIRKYHALAFTVSGLFGGLFGGLQALYVYSIEPVDYGFALIVTILTMVVLGGRTTLLGPIVGAAILALIPEIVRPLAEYRQLLNGIILVLVITFLPNGVGDEIVFYFRRKLRARRAKNTETKGGEGGAVTSNR
jgi:branched-chain amino acid transport system permease protein